MPIRTIDLVKRLIIQFNRFKELSAVFEPELQRTDVTFSVSLSYSTLRFNIKQSDDLYFQYTHQREGTLGAGQSECYHHDSKKIDSLKNHFESLVDSMEDTVAVNSSGNVKYTDELNTYLTIAESIAACAYLCAAGDDYRPGYFSEIIIHTDGILLKQVNRMNSKSLNHKENYSLRDLEFFIPQKLSTDKKPSEDMKDDYIGIMRIHFSDRSSQNNKQCGAKILEKIEETKLTFGK